MTATTPARSYDPAVQAGGWLAERARLEAQAASSWPVEASRLSALGVVDGMRILELGCGVGAVTRRLRETYPASPITAVDHDPRMLETVASQRLAHVELVAADIGSTGLPADSHDVILSRYLLQHLADPSVPLVEGLRVLRRGGLHVVIDIDDQLWGLCTPAMPGLAPLYAKAATAQARRGGDRFIGRALGRLLTGAGYTGATLDAFAYDSDAVGMAALVPQISPDRLIAAVDRDTFDLTETILLNQGFDGFLTAPGAYVLMLGFIAHGWKPL